MNPNSDSDLSYDRNTHKECTFSNSIFDDEDEDEKIGETMYFGDGGITIPSILDAHGMEDERTTRHKANLIKQMCRDITLEALNYMALIINLTKTMRIIIIILETTQNQNIQ